jgi:hypothetical protein
LSRRRAAASRKLCLWWWSRSEGSTWLHPASIRVHPAGRSLQLGVMRGGGPVGAACAGS